MVLEVELYHCQEIEILEGKLWNEINKSEDSGVQIW
jgi:hypothetical protein